MEVEAPVRSQEEFPLELSTRLDDYVCYRDSRTDRFGPAFERQPIEVSDAFGAVSTDVIGPKLRCNPASIDAPIESALRSLECFDLEPHRVRQTLALFDRIGQFVEDVKTSRAVSLCVPSSEHETELHGRVGAGRAR